VAHREPNPKNQSCPPRYLVLKRIEQSAGGTPQSSRLVLRRPRAAGVGRQNAVRHGLYAETVVEIHEDVEGYRGFYDATAVERELVLRLLGSLLWRLRRAAAIETDLLRK